MKKLLLVVASVAFFGTANAQSKSGGAEQTAEGKFLIEANTGFGIAGNGGQIGSTGIGFTSGDGFSSYNFGVEGGYFVMENLAIKAGLGYGGSKADGGTAVNALGYKIGAKYYVINMIPVEVYYNGTSRTKFEGESDTKNPSFVGIGAGYAIFLGDNVSIEPGLRYNNTMDKDVAKSFFQFNVGFALHF